MYRRLLFVIIVLALNGCVIGEQDTYHTSFDIPEGHQAFDRKAMRAFGYEKIGDYEGARDEYLQIFRDFGSEQALENAFMLSLFNNLDKKDEINALAKPYLASNAALARYSAVYHMQKDELNEAQSILDKLIKWDKDFRNYELLGDLAIKSSKRDFKLALKHYQASKARLPEENAPNEVLALKISETQVLLGDLNAAKVELEGYVDEAGCSVRVCIFLAKIYHEKGEQKQLDAMYVRLYELTKDESFLRVLLDRLLLEKKFEQALEISLKYGFDDNLSLFLYQQLGKFKEAYELALRAYERSNDKKYLLIAAVMEFEDAMNSKKIDKSLLSSVSSKFEQGIDESSGALYLNYYGYLLIDYDLDVAKGINLVKRALIQEPNNLFYLDSLSWGYYKQGECGAAWDVMLKTMHDREFSNSDESKEHIKAIQQCLIKEKR